MPVTTHVCVCLCPSKGFPLLLPSSFISVSEFIIFSLQRQNAASANNQKENGMPLNKTPDRDE